MADPTLPSDDVALERLLVKLAASPPAVPAVDNSPWDFLLRQPDALLEHRVLPLMLRLLVSADPLVQRRAIGILVNLPATAATAQELLDRIGARVDLFRREPELTAAAAHAVATLAALTGRERDAAPLIRALVAPGLPPAGAITPLAIFEPDYVLETLREAGAAAPAGVAAGAAAMFALYHRDGLLGLLSELAALSLEARTHVLQRIALFLEVDEARGAAMASRLGLPAPTTAPSLQQCREALRVAPQ